MITLTVTLRARPGHLPQFLDAITENAERSCADEPGCRAFHVSQDVKDDHAFVLYEVYDDQSALEAHRTMAHFHRWRAQVDAHVEPGSQANRVGERLLTHNNGQTP